MKFPLFFADGGDKRPPPPADAKEDAGVHGPGGESSDDISTSAQEGVQGVEATTKVWTRNHIVLAYVFIWVIAFVDSMQQSMSFSLTPYVTSSFSLHSLTAATAIMAHLLGGLLKLPLAKVLDIWGRPQGFAVTTLIQTIGLVMMAACNNVQMYAAAQVFYVVGYNGMTYSLSVFIADTSALKNRALMFAFLFSPFIITTWISGPVAESFLANGSWRWAFGTFAIVTPVMTAPLIALFYYNYRKAIGMGLLVRKRSERTWPETAKHYFVEFDIVGLLLISAGLALFLLPFSLYSYQAEQWRSPLIICMLVFGVVLLGVFVAYEKLVAPVQFFPYRLCLDRTIMGSMVLTAVMFIAYFIWDNFFLSFLQVVMNLTVTEATYVGKIFNIGSCLWGIVVGILVRWSGRFKWLAAYFAIPLTFLGTGLMIHFRQPGADIGYVVMCQIFIAFAGGTIVICQSMAAMASVTHQHIAVILAIQAMFSSIGASIGSTVASALWTGIFPNRLGRYLPPESQGNLTTIYGDLVTQLSYPVGSPTRDAIVRAYGDTQRLMLISSLGVLALAVPAVLVWRDIKVKDFKQVKGTVV